jgi:hypothetical protein
MESPRIGFQNEKREHKRKEEVVVCWVAYFAHLHRNGAVRVVLVLAEVINNHLHWLVLA